MISSSTLSQTQDEIRDCITSHASTLVELFRVTGAFVAADHYGRASLASTQKWAFDENAFLNANKLQEGRIFDLSTLPAIQEPVRSYTSQSSPPPDLSRSLLERPRNHAQPSVPPIDVHSAQAEQDKEPRTKRPRTTDLPPKEYTPELIKQDAPAPTEDLPASLGGPDALATNSSVLGNVGSTIVAASQPLADQTSSEATRQEPATDDAQDHEMPDAPSGGHLQQDDQGVQGQAHEPIIKEGAHPIAKSSDPPNEGSVLLDAPATPGAQLRFEEAQSLKDVQSEGLDQSTDSGALVAKEDGTTDLAQGTTADESNLTTPSEAQPQSHIDPEVDNASFRYGGLSEAPALGLRNSAFAGIDEALTLSQRPPIRIDTGAPTLEVLKPASDKMGSPPKVASSKSTAATTPQTEDSRQGPSSTPIHARRERMTTRVSSGALGRKSVSEILGGPRTAPLPADKSERASSTNNREQGQETPLKAPASARLASHLSASSFRFPEIRDNERNKLPTVVFQGNKSAKEQDTADQARKDQIKYDPAHNDFLLPLFVAQALAPQTHSLHHLAYTNHKTLSTSDSRIDFDEQLHVRLLSKIYNLQNSHRWSLRQHERSQEPARPTSHWDHVLGQVKWMRTDFREERKWKMAAARAMAISCAEWVTSSKRTRSALQVKTRPSSTKAGSTPISVPTPDLIPSTEDDPSDIEDVDAVPQEALVTIAPARVFTLPPDMFIFGMEKGDASDKILSELPLYEPPSASREGLSTLATDPDATWKRPIVPFSKHVEGKILCQTQKPPRKKSRYDYSSDDGSGRYANDAIVHSDPIASASNVDHPVALFDPANKHIRDRIHLGHAFRPPSEYGMPLQSFFEHRSPSQWTQSEDDDLRRYVREYAYNWSLISSCLAMPSRCTSGAERRTPWECFERWVILEGMPAEMAKHPYYRAYTSRMQAAQRNYDMQQQAQQQQQQQAGNNQMPTRRRSTQPFLVERRKTNKHLHMIDAMRKLAKKREAARAKQEHVAQTSALRRAQEPQQPRSMMQTPQEFSQKKHEKDLFQKEQFRQYRLQLLQTQKMEAARRAQLAAQMNGVTSNAPLNRAPPPPAMNGASPNMSAALPNGQSSNHIRGGGMPPGSRIPNGIPVTGGLASSQSVPHAPMQPHMQMSQRVPSQMANDMRRYEEAARQQAEQQRYLIQQRHQQAPSNPQSGKLASPNMGNMNSAPHNPAMYAPMQNGRAGSPVVNGTYPTSGSSASPRIGSSQPQPLSSGMVPLVNQMQNQVRNKNPGASPEQIKALTTEAMNTQYRLNHSQQVVLQAAPASNFAATANNSSVNGIGSSQQTQQSITNGVGGGQYSTSQQYAALIRQQQQQQQSQQNRNASAGMGGMRPGSRAGTPQIHPGGASQSPKPSSAQAVGGQ